MFMNKQMIDGSAVFIPTEEFHRYRLLMACNKEGDVEYIRDQIIKKLNTFFKRKRSKLNLIQ